jgi:asparaginyl-tRNA synthetase
MTENETAINTESTKVDQTQTDQAAAEKQVRPEYTGDKGEYPYSFSRDTPIEKKPVAVFTFGQRVRIQALAENYEPYLDHVIQVAGWARTTRMGGKDFAFIELTDGTCSTTLQVVVDSSMPNFDEVAISKVGASYKFKGKLIKSPAKGQLFELQVCHPEKHACQVIGQCDGATYPLPTKRHTNEYLREHANLRPRTKLISSVTRVRNNLAYATHKFFQERGFLYIHTPCITASDCEGAGEMFQVTTALPKPEKPIKETPLLEREG